MEQVRTELKRSGTISLNDTDVRKLAGRTSGTISMADLRGKKASENVANYQIYQHIFNYTWDGNHKYGNDTLNFPKKIIAGTLIVKCTWEAVYSFDKKVGYMNILNEKVEQTTKNFSISNVSSIPFSYYTGYSVNPRDGGNSKKSNGKLYIDIKFTGEWEA